MKVLIIGDKFITNEVFLECFKKIFKNYPGEFEFRFHSTNWPLEPLKKNSEVAEFTGDDSEIIDLIKDAEILLTHTGCITKRVISAAGRLKVVGVGRGGPVNINIKACTERGIPVVYAPGRNAEAVAEFTIGLIIAATRNIVTSHVSFHGNKKWRGDLYDFSNVGNELSHSTVGIIGFGAVGSRVAKILNAFGSRVIVYDPYISEAQKAEHNCEFVDLETLLKESDIISLHARYTKETKKMIDKEKIAMMKKSAIFINTARGELVDYDALYEALKKRRIAGAALDVFEAEPPPTNSELFNLDNVIACTHLAGASKQAAYLGAQKACEGVYQYLVGEVPQYCANKEVLIAKK